MRFRRLLLVSALALLAGSMLASRADVAPARGAGSVPACEYLDILTAYRSPADWQRTLVDPIFMVPQSYVPPDLVPVSRAGIGGNGSVRAIVIPDLTEMTTAAKAVGAPIAVQSAYRSYAYQVATFRDWVDRLGSSSALAGSARPGHSEHQLGLAIDFRSADGSAPWSGSDWATSPAGAWMKANAWKYGFVMSYPSWAAKPVTCYSYEPWHYRYVGRGLAAAIHAAGVTSREYLWYQMGNSVMASWITPTAPTPTPSPTSTPNPTPTPSATREPPVATSGSIQPSGAPPSDPISPAGASLAVAIGLVILVAVEQVDRLLRDRWRRIRAGWPRRTRTFAQARRSSSVPFA